MEPDVSNWPHRQAPPELVFGSFRVFESQRGFEKMKPNDLELMSVDELWSFRAQLRSVLAGKISAEKVKIDRQLRQLDLGAAPDNSKKIAHARRPYPQVFPKYSNPAKPSETWAGRGKQPRWLTAQLRAGKKLDDFRIQRLPGRSRRSTR
jgi:DNA-binding protein H-NS